MKKILIIINFYLIISSFIGIRISKTVSFFAGLTKEGIYDTMEDVDQYIIDQYGQKQDFKLITTHNYGVLSTRNVSYSYFQFKYNNQLDMTSVNNKFDLNGDKKITYEDNIGSKKIGFCSPVAAAIAIRYLVYCGKISYTPRIKYALYGEFTDDPNEVFNVFYELVDSYITFGWNGNEATSKVTTDSINHFLHKNNNKFNLIYTEKNLLNHIDTSYNNGFPCLAYIIFKNDPIGHIATIAGYYTKEITYTEKLLFITNTKKVKLNFVVINTGWNTPNMGDSGGSTQEEYNDNYSYILLSNIQAINYFEEV